MKRVNRAMNQLRECKWTLDYVPWAAGSVLISWGNTVVLCNVSEADRVPAHCLESGHGWITAEYAMLPHSGQSRSPRDGRPKIKGRTYEIQRLIGRSLRAGVNLEKLGARSLTLDCDVIMSDGGTRTASVTGGWLALRMALHRIFHGDLPDGLLMHDWVAAVSAGHIEGKNYLDLDYVEDSNAEIDLNLVAAEKDAWIEVQGTREGGNRGRVVFMDLMDMAQSGIATLIHQQQSVYQDWISGIK